MVNMKKILCSGTDFSPSFLSNRLKSVPLLLLIASILSSCSNNYLSGGNEIFIRKIDGSNYNYKLLSVRDSSLVVIDAKNDAPLENSYSHAEIIRFDSIYKVYRAGKRTESQYIIAATAGFIGGALSGESLAPPATAIPPPIIPAGSFYEVPTQYDYSKTYIDAAIGAVAGAAVGYFLARIIPPNEKQLHPIILQDKDFLRQISKYPDIEPPELQKIK